MADSEVRRVRRPSAAQAMCGLHCSLGHCADDGNKSHTTSPTTTATSKYEKKSVGRWYGSNSKITIKGEVKTDMVTCFRYMYLGPEYEIIGGNTNGNHCCQLCLKTNPDIKFISHKIAGNDRVCK